MRVIWVETPPDGSITIGAAAVYMGLAPSTANVYCSLDDGPDHYRDAAERIGRRYFMRGDLDRWLFAHPGRGRPPGGRPKTLKPAPRPAVTEVPARVVRATDRKRAPPPDQGARRAAAVRDRIATMKAKLARAELELAGLLIEGGP